MTPCEFVQGNLELMDDLTNRLAALCGMDGGTLAPNAGAQGEFVGLQLILAYLNDPERNEVIVPDSAHGTNPATSTMCGMKTITIKTGADGDVDLEDLKKHLSNKTAALMLTNPSTLGLFNRKILEIKELYYDGANLNPLLGVIRPGDMGFDVMHLNLHKTFSTPHGGGGPGSGPVFCKKHLIPFLPLPRIEKTDNGYRWTQAAQSIGHISSFHGNFGILVRAYLYYILHGNYGLRRVAENCTLNANYVKAHLSKFMPVPFDRPCMHEFVAQSFKETKAIDIAKRLIDFHIHPMTIYFPQIVKEAMLIEPCETESKATLDHFIEVMKVIKAEVEQNPELIKDAPFTTPLSRLDEAQAARSPCITAC
jgi:glycine dehydrogenase subunit 2